METVIAQGGRPPVLEDRYARVTLEVMKIERVAPSGALLQLLHRWGLHTQPQECFWVIATDAAGNVRTVVETARGGHAEVAVHVPSVMTAVLTAGGVVFAVAHNHPTLSPWPSVEDQDLTHAMMDAANACGLVFEDHVVVEPGGTHFSFRDAGLIVPAPRGGGLPLAVPRRSSPAKISPARTRRRSL